MPMLLNGIQIKTPQLKVGSFLITKIEVTINIDGRRMARVLIPAIQSEQDRVEAETIIRTK
ncbi:MAG TPA: hypothetical protein GXX23_02825 [Firmicutes bacterium]|nr:hypothetical protein [Candidatus Fermentithermobacillaceae bacterium]